MDETEKNKFETILNQLGLTPAQAFKIFAKKTIEAGGIPFEVSQPSNQLTAAINSHDYKEFTSAAEGLKWLHEWN